MKTKMSGKTHRSKSVRKSRTVEMIAYFDGIEGEAHRSLWANFKVENVIYLKNAYSKAEREFEGFRSLLYSKIIKGLFNDEYPEGFYSLVMAYLSGNESIKTGIENFPQGETAIIGHINVLDESLSTFLFLDTKEFEDSLKQDYLVTAYKTDNELDDIHVTLEEVIFLAVLVELIKLTGNNCCNLPNEELFRFSTLHHLPRKWIADTLGKFKSKNIIGIHTYDHFGRSWFRDIYIVNSEVAEHITFEIETRRSA